MLEKPDISEAELRDHLREHYAIPARSIGFLPIGNDRNTAVYRAETNEDTYFLKVRLGDFDEMSAMLPALLRDQRVPSVIAPIENRQGAFWTDCDQYRLILYPFVQGRTGFDVQLSDRNWMDLGKCLRALHETTLPAHIEDAMRHETFSSRWRDEVRQLLAGNIEPFDAVTRELARFWRTRRVEITELVDRAEELAPVAQREVSTFVPCHGDIHGRNVLIDASGVLHVVDWDTALLAPKERDLMFIGGGVGGIWNDEREAALFYEGYGPANVSAAALAYYRYDRIVEDIAVTSVEILSQEFSDADREKWIRQLERQFIPGNVVEMAQQSYERLSR